MESMWRCVESMGECMESMVEYMEQKHSTWNPPGMWGQGKLLLASDAGGGDTNIEMGDLDTAEDAYASMKVMGDQD